MIQPNTSHHLFDFLPPIQQGVQRITIINTHAQQTRVMAIRESRFQSDIALDVGAGRSLFNLYCAPQRTVVQKQWRASFKTKMKEWRDRLFQANTQLSHGLNTLKEMPPMVHPSSVNIEGIKERATFVRALMAQHTVWRQRKGAVIALLESNSSLDFSKTKTSLQEQQEKIDEFFSATIENAWWVDKIVQSVEEVIVHFKNKLKKEKLAQAEIQELVEFSEFLKILPRNSDVFNLQISDHINHAKSAIGEILRQSDSNSKKD